MKSAKSRKKTSAGRPSRRQAEKIQDKILDAAAELFFTEGYGATSVEAIAKRTRIAKRTFYSRFKNKGEIFGAVVHRIIDRLRPSDPTPLFQGKSVEETLHKLARVILRAALTPQVLALHHVILAEATRFPELALIVTEQGARQEAIKHIAALLEREGATKNIKIGNPLFAAEQFLQMLTGVPQRRAMGLGKPLSPTELDAWAYDTVNLFLKGCWTSQ